MLDNLKRQLEDLAKDFQTFKNKIAEKNERNLHPSIGSFGSAQSASQQDMKANMQLILINLNKLITVWLP